MSNQEFAGKVALVTGAGKKISRPKSQSLTR